MFVLFSNLLPGSCHTKPRVTDVLSNYIGAVKAKWNIKHGATVAKKIIAPFDLVGSI